MERVRERVEVGGIEWEDKAEIRWESLREQETAMWLLVAMYCISLTVSSQYLLC